MKNKIKFSFVMVVHTMSSYLKESIDSILEQKVDKELFDFDVIIVNNSSDDNVSIFLQSFISSNLKVYKSEYNHLSYSLNYGISKTNSDYIVRIDDDDICYSDRLIVLYEYITKNHYPDVIGSYADIIDHNGNIKGVIEQPLKNKEIRQKLLTGVPFIHPSVSIKKSTFIHFGGYIGGHKAQDFDLWLRMSLDNTIVFLNIPLKTIQYRIHEGQTKGKRNSYIDSITSHFRFFLSKPSLLTFLAILYRSFRLFINKN